MLLVLVYVTRNSDQLFYYQNKNDTLEGYIFLLLVLDLCFGFESRVSTVALLNFRGREATLSRA